jgi:hypothetical protein
MPEPAPRISLLPFDDEPVASIQHGAVTLKLSRGPGSGLARGGHDPRGCVWAIGDRGPNLPTARRDVKILPAPQLGPSISQLQVSESGVRVVRRISLHGTAGRPLTGLPLPGTGGEAALDLEGRPYAGDPMGADTEGLAVARDGSFRVADEYGPSILHVSADGEVTSRWVPIGTGPRYVGADCHIVEVLPAIAATRRLNRGFEGIAFSSDERWLYVAFQSALEGDPDLRHSRIWKLDAASGELAAEYLYPFDEPHTFLRDRALGDFDWPDLKVCELTCIDAGRLLVLERGSATSRLYVVALPDAHGSAVIEKSLLLDTDEHPAIGADLEGMALLSPSTVLLVNDNDFGIAGVLTRFWRVELSAHV